MSLLLDVLVIALAVCQFVEVIHHGSLFRSLRRWAAVVLGHEAKDTGPTPAFVIPPFKWFLASWVHCPFCLSHVAGFAFALWWFGLTWRLPVLWLAGVRAANLINDLTHHWTRSPDPEGEEDDTDDDGTDADDEDGGDDSAL